jgi:3alpha(or 20beta)-hydroxysteroid dehydrogenase
MSTGVVRLYMEGKVAIVTEADGGLGKSVTQALLDRGVMVVGTSRKIQANELQHQSFLGIPADISNEDAAKQLVDQVLSRFGKQEVLVHTVGDSLVDRQSWIRTLTPSGE